MEREINRENEKIAHTLLHMKPNIGKRKNAQHRKFGKMIRQGARRADSQSMMMGSSTAYNESFLRQSPRNFNRYPSIADNSLMS